MLIKRLTLPLLACLLLAFCAWALVHWFSGAAPGTAETAPAALRYVDPASIRVMTANIRYASPSDKGQLWEDRRGYLVTTLKKYDPDILGLQEVTPAQLTYLLHELTAYRFLPSGPATSGDFLSGLVNLPGSMDQLLFRADRFSLIRSAAGALRPDAPQANPTENAYYTLAVLHDDKGTLGNLIVIDTHLRHDVANAVICAQKIQALLADQLAQTPGARLIVMGDINHDRTTPIWPALIGPKDSPARLRDTFDYAHMPPTQPWGTYHGFTGHSSNPWPTDLIFVSESAHATPAQIIRDQDAKTGHWPSDHFLVLTTLTTK